MSVSVEGGPKGRRRPVGAELNLVAYIDLLTCMVSFLLITAVWAQLARLPVSQHQPGQPDGETVTEDFRIVVVVNGDGFSLVVGGESQPISNDYKRLDAALRAAKSAHPDKTDVQVASADDIVFSRLIETMDVVLGAGFPDVSLVDAAGT